MKGVVIITKSIYTSEQELNMMNGTHKHVQFKVLPNIFTSCATRIYDYSQQTTNISLDIFNISFHTDSRILALLWENMIYRST